VSQLGVGYIGCGTIFNAHIEAVSSISDLKVIGVSSLNYEVAKRRAEEVNCKYYKNTYELINDDEVDLVVLLTPPGAHYELINLALDKGKHVIAEKPIGTNLEEIDSYIQKADKKNLTLSCVSQHRFDDASIFVRDKIDHGALGKITGANCLVNWYRDQEYYMGWRSVRDLSGGGVLSIQAIHTIDLMLWYMGDVESVMAYTNKLSHSNIEVEDIAMAAIKFKNGSLGMISASTCTYPGYPARLDIFGDEGSITIEADEVVYYQSKNDPKNSLRVSSNGETVDNPGKVTVESFRRQYGNVIDSIKGNYEPLVSGKEARKAYALLTAIYESTKQGKEIKL
jgi:UDP-N-acetyl-2-amino-2-deoxyglucuronate dehydrogenase